MAVKKTTRYTQRDPGQRKRFLRLRERYRRKAKHFIYVDESGFELQAARRFGYAPRGKRVYGEVSGQKRPRTSLLAARMADGKLAATLLWEGTCNTCIFNLWCKELLSPLLDENSVVVWDNASFHKCTSTRELIEQTGAKLLFLPPYSPDLNPIEHDFGALKKIREYNNEKTIDEIIRMYN